MAVNPASTANSATPALVWKHTNVWAGSKLLATYNKDGLHFYLDDWLGTRRARLHGERRLVGNLGSRAVQHAGRTKKTSRSALRIGPSQSICANLPRRSGMPVSAASTGGAGS